MNTTFDDGVAVLAAQQYGLVSLHQVRELGGTRSMVALRLERRRWWQPAPRVFGILGAPFTWHQKMLAATLAAGPGAVASHLSAAALLEIPGFGTGRVEITLPRGRRLDLAVDRYLQTNLLWPHHVKLRNAIPTTGYARTLFDLGAVIHPLRAERALDTCLARKWVTLPALWTVLFDLAEHGRAGTVLMRELLMARGPGYVPPASEIEAEVLAIIRAARLPEPDREIDLGDGDGWIGRVEFVWRPQRGLLEVDGDWWHTSLTDRRHDAARDERFDAEGWTVERVPYDVVKNDPNEVVKRVRHILGFVS